MFGAYSQILYIISLAGFATGGSLGGDEDIDDQTSAEKSSTSGSFVSLEARGVTLTFKDVNYLVKASTTKDKLHLLKGISGHFTAGKLTALMGSSGAGKTTLMVRKSCC